MDVTEFAERIVLGDTLEDKLAKPGKLSFTDTPVSASLQKITNPGRPYGLALHDGPGAAHPPADRDLDQQQARGKLLHFFANHELLATELMALVLLKFPDAPLPFRQGVLRTLQEEQAHTRLYLRRMEECGIEFGTFPLSGHFWRIVAPMQSPMDFVSRLSLTFEQANLDYSQHYATLFDQVGDGRTAKILERIYHDEIGHVQHGLKWFRQWKDPHQSDWEAYQAELQFPMSPQRGRGPNCVFNRQGRELAGLSADFIDAMEVYRQSRGRPPSVRWFNPGIEAELSRLQVSDRPANQPASQASLPPREGELIEQVQRDLELVMVGLARQDDVQLVRRVPSVAFRQRLLNSGLELPEFLPLEEASQLRERKLRELCPWAWSPSDQPLQATLAPQLQVKPQGWQDLHTDLYTKSWSLQRCQTWLAAAAPSWLSAGPRGYVVHSMGDLDEALQRIGHEGYSTALVKHDLATSGRGQRRLSCRGREPDDENWLAAFWSDSDTAVVVPELDRLVDLSFLWEPSNEATAFRPIGWTRQLVTAGRRYAGTRLSRPFEDCAGEIKRFLLADQCRCLRETQAWLAERLIPELGQRGFRHSFGVDAIIHRTPDGELRLHPLIELNPRVTMGHAALAFRPHVAPRGRAEFRIFTRREWEQVPAELLDRPLERAKDGRWTEGIVPLTEVRQATKLVAAVVVNQTPLLFAGA